LREKGPDRLSVAEVMQAAGLTHGGFYAHFKSKDALLVEALSAAFARAGANSGVSPKACRPDMRSRPISTCMCRPSIATMSGGCPIVALNSDAPRQSKKFQAAFQAGVDHIVDALGRMDRRNRPRRCAGTCALGVFGHGRRRRALSRRARQRLSDELLASARAGIRARLGVSDAELSKAVN
jgi:TetR/AcrR family transcriptional regulator, transcriptional repressor for nem operon